MEIIVDGKGRSKEVNKASIIPTNEIAFPDKKHVVYDSSAVIDNVIEQQKLRKEAEPGQQRCEVRIKTDMPYILVLGSSDWHLGSEHTDYALFKKHYDLVSETEGVFVNVIGDERDNFVTPKLRAGLFEGVLNPQQQADMIESLLRGWDDKNKILARCGGNHDNWSWEGIGVRLENYWFKEMKAPLMNTGGFEHLIVNDIEYVGWLHHGLSAYNSTFNPNHASRRSFEMQGPFDFSMMGHTHTAEVAQAWRWSEEFAKPVVMLRTGTYKTEDMFGKSRQFPRGQMPGTCILFSTQEKKMMGFSDLESGITVLKALTEFEHLGSVGMLGVSHEQRTV